VPLVQIGDEPGFYRLAPEAGSPLDAVAASSRAAVVRLRLRARGLWRDRDRAGTGGRTNDVRRWHSSETENARDIPAADIAILDCSLGLTRLY
jgi:hypothetical protein